MIENTLTIASEFSRPYGTNVGIDQRFPSDESLGYFQTSLREERPRMQLVSIFVSFTAIHSERRGKWRRLLCRDGGPQTSMSRRDRRQ
jgi:hypothetical protein